MARLFLVRHGRAAAAFDAHPDPGLDPLGREQAERFATTFATTFAIGPRAQGEALPILASPLQRTRETALPLARIWQTQPRLEPRVAELPSPPELPLARRGEWIRDLLGGNWSQAPADLQVWRETLLSALLEISQDSVVFTHFIAINVAFGAANGDDRILVTQPDHCSCTEIATDGGQLRLLAQGRQLETEIL